MTGNYIGDLAQMPRLLTGMIVVTGLIPAIMAVIGIIVLKFYPIDHETRLKIQEFIKNHEVHKNQEQ